MLLMQVYDAHGVMFEVLPAKAKQLVIQNDWTLENPKHAKPPHVPVTPVEHEVHVVSPGVEPVGAPGQMIPEPKPVEAPVVVAPSRTVPPASPNAGAL